MKQRIIVSSEPLRNRSAAVCATIPLDEPHEVVIRPYKLNRTDQANRYYWAIITCIANDLGYSKDEFHDWCKGEFLTRIFERDDPEYAAMYRHIRETGTGNMLNKMIVMTSTTDSKPPQFTEYIEDIKHHAASLGIRLPLWEDYA